MFKFILLASLLAITGLCDPIAQKPVVASAPAAAVVPKVAVVPQKPALPAAVPKVAVPVLTKSAPPAVEITSRNAASASSAAASLAALGNITFSVSGPSSCPPSHLFSPCECFVHGEGARIIRCSGEHNLDLLPIFQRLSIYLPKPDKHFHMFYLNNTNISYLGNVFHDITFEYIYFDGASSLEFIDPNAFDVTGPYVKEVRAFNTKLKQKSLEDSLLGLSSLVHLTVSNVGKCPPEELLRPCRCEYRNDNWQWVQAKFTRFVCGEETEEELRMQYVLNANRTKEQFAYSQTRRMQIYFERLSDNLGKLGWQKRFDEFVLQNSAISEVPRNLFHDVIFYNIKFDNCPELTSVHPQAFQITEPFVEELVIRKTRLGNERWKLRDTFNAITSLTNLRSLKLDQSGLSSIPHHAFRPLKGRFQRKLVSISINNPNSRDQSIRQVGSYAFYYLSNLKSIDLSVNNIDKLHKNAFSFRWESTETLEINLAGNNLSDTSFEQSSFVETQRPVRLILGKDVHTNPELRHLDERVFRPLLNENEKNVITLESSLHPSGGNRLQCDCQSRWIFNEFGKIRSGLKDVMCVSNGSWECLPPCLVFGNDLLHCGSNQFFNIEDVFYSLNRNLLPEEKHFKRFMLSNLQIETIPNKSFGDITFEEFELDDCPNLKYIDERAFSNTKENLTKITIHNTPQLQEMRFSTFQYLRELNIKFTGKFRLTDESFKSDLPTDTLLKLNIDVDGLQSNSIETNALSYAYRPIHVTFDHPVGIGKQQQCRSLTLEEEIFAPFLAVNPENRVRSKACPIECGCAAKWIFDSPKDWWIRVEAGDPNVGLQCHDQRSLYFYSDYDFRSCPKSNLLKYFVSENAGKMSTEVGASSIEAAAEVASASSQPISSTYSGSNEAVKASKPVLSQPAIKIQTDTSVGEVRNTNDVPVLAEPKEGVIKTVVTEPKVSEPVDDKETIAAGASSNVYESTELQTPASQVVPSASTSKVSKEIKSQY